MIIVEMRKLFTEIGACIRRLVDFFYPPFRRWVPQQVFRYAVCGGANVLWDWVLFFLLVNYVFHQQVVRVGGWAFEAHTAALAVSFPVSTLTGFLLQKYVTFTASDLHGRVQLARYLMVVAFNLLLNYAGLKLFIEVCGFWDTPSKMLVTCLCTLVSYLCQKHFTFRVRGGRA